MAKIQEVSPDEPSSTSQPLEQVQNHDENDVFANVRRHSEQPESINDTYVLEKDDSDKCLIERLKKTKGSKNGLKTDKKRKRQDKSEE
ncbi:hypothetical protein Tco_1025148 [Tanacetum coccineum]